MIKLTTPLTKQKIAKLKAGDEVLLSGEIYTARDQAHKKIIELIKGKRNYRLRLKTRLSTTAGLQQRQKVRQ